MCLRYGAVNLDIHTIHPTIPGEPKLHITITVHLSQHELGRLCPIFDVYLFNFLFTFHLCKVKIEGLSWWRTDEMEGSPHVP